MLHIRQIYVLSWKAIKDIIKYQFSERKNYNLNHHREGEWVIPTHGIYFEREANSYHQQWQKKAIGIDGSLMARAMNKERKSQKWTHGTTFLGIIKLCI